MPTLRDLALEGFLYVLVDEDGTPATIYRQGVPTVCAYRRKSLAQRDMLQLCMSGEYSQLRLLALTDGLYGKGYYA